MKGVKFPNIDFSKFILPPVELKIVRRNDVLKVYDILRKDYFVLTEEEFVRQAFVAWMTIDLHYPPSVMANEIGIKLNNTYKRCDTVVFAPDGQPLMIIEYKSPSVNITQEVFNQVVRYNMALQAKYLVVSNGYTNYCCFVNYDNHSVEFLKSIPLYEDIILNESKL